MQIMQRDSVLAGFAEGGKRRRRQVIIPFFIAHQGCPHRCIFCDQEKISGGLPRFPTEGEILDTIYRCRPAEHSPNIEIAFYGGSFTALPRVDQKRLLLPLQPLLAAGEIGSVRISTRPDGIDHETAVFLRQMGVATVELGIQSLDEGVLTRAGRGYSPAVVGPACAILRETGFSIGAQLLPGLPGETLETAFSSVRQTLALRPDFLRIYPALVIAGTPLARLYAAGVYEPLSLATAVAWCKEMLLEALCAGVPVIRMGLQPATELQAEGTVLAGPFHPAFRQLVEAELCLDLLLTLTEGCPSGSDLTIMCAPGRYSDVVGQQRLNCERLCRRRGIRSVAVVPDPCLPARVLGVEWLGTKLYGDMVHDRKNRKSVTAA